MGFGKNNTGAILRSKESIALGTLNVDTAIKLGSGITISEDFRLLKIEVWAHIDGLTAGEGDGLMIGIANGELTVAEIAEALLADGPSDRNDRVKTERAERFVKIFGSLNDLQHLFRGENGGHMLIVKPRWTFSNPEGWDLFIFNNGVQFTTGATAKLIVTFYGLWLT